MLPQSGAFLVFPDPSASPTALCEVTHRSLNQAGPLLPRGLGQTRSYFLGLKCACPAAPPSEPRLPQAASRGTPSDRPAEGATLLATHRAPGVSLTQRPPPCTETAGSIPAPTLRPCSGAVFPSASPFLARRGIPESSMEQYNFTGKMSQVTPHLRVREMSEPAALETMPR